MKETTYRVAYSLITINGKVTTGSMDISFTGSSKVNKKTILIFDEQIRKYNNDIAKLIISSWSRIYD